MEPFGHRHHHHQHHQPRDDEEEHQSLGPPPPHINFADAPPPPGLYQSEPHFSPYPNDSFIAEAPPPPSSYRPEPYLEAPAPPHPFGQVSHVGHTSGEPYPPDHRYGGYEPHPPQNSIYGEHTNVSHVSHHQIHDSHMPSAFDHRPDENRLPDNLVGLAGRPTVKVYSKAEPDYYLTIRDGKVILAPADPSDEAQHWYKDEKYSTRVKDAEGYPCFALVNKATGEAVKHSIGATQPVELVRYDPDRFDESVLWSESKDMGGGYRKIRMVNDIQLNMDAFHGDRKSGGVRDGTLIVLWDWNKGDNQLWKIFPFFSI